MFSNPLTLEDFLAVADDDAAVGLVDMPSREIVDGAVGVGGIVSDTLDSRDVGLLYIDEVARLDVGLLDSGDVHYKHVCSTVGIAAYALISVVTGIDKLITPRLVGSRQHEMAAVVVEFEGGMQLRFGLELVAPDDEEAVSGDDGRRLRAAFGDLAFLGTLDVIREVHAFDIDGTGGSVLEFQSVIALELLIDEDGVLGTYLIYTYRRDALCSALSIGEWGVAGHQ